MMNSTPSRLALTAADIQEQRARLHQDWQQLGKQLQRVYAFQSYDAAVAFTNRAAQLAQQLDHHPDLLLTYDKVTVTLSTHSAGGLTSLDFDFANKLDATD